MSYGPGMSVKVWQDLLLPSDELWEGEYNGDCIENAKKNNQLKGVNAVYMDQDNMTTVTSWLRQIQGTMFDIIIDDGGKIIMIAIVVQMLCLTCRHD